MALLALVLQLGLSFGHVHVAHAVHPGFAVPASAQGAATPATTDDDDHEAHYCAIYAINALLTGAQAASAPVVAAPTVFGSVEIAFVLEAARIIASRAAFNSRAPPRS